MTVEERAKKTVREWHDNEQELMKSRKRSGYWKHAPMTFAEWSARLEARFAQALRNLIEECANVATDRESEIGHMINEYKPDSYVYNRGVTQIDECNLIEDRIRALAEPKPETEGKED